eukprot:4229825-Heterocapsa_arctica.AAC.1
MTIVQLMKVRRVVNREGDGIVYTIRPWAGNLNAARCPNCHEFDHRTICPVGMLCRYCAHPLQRAQEDLTIHDKGVDDAALKRFSERRSLYQDEPA